MYQFLAARIAFGFSFALLLLSVVLPASAQQESSDVQLYLPANRDQMNLNTVSIMTGRSHSIHLRFVEDMANILDDGLKLRIVPMVGKGAVQNVFDLLHLKNVDMAVTQADVLSYLKRNNSAGANIERKLLYVTKLFNEELHLIASPDIPDINSLNGKRVNVGRVGSGTQITSTLIFSALGIEVVTAHLEEAEALAAIRNGELDASLIIAGKPTAIFDIAGVDQGLKFLDIPYADALEEDYLPTILTHEDYPTLIGEGQSIDTIAVPAVLTVFNWSATNDRYRRTAQLVQAFFDNVAKLRAEHRHEKWKELNLIAPLKGWQRFGPAQQWLDRHLANLNRNEPARREQSAARTTRGSLVEFIRNRAGAANLSPEAQDRLFSEFLEWQKQNSAGANEPAKPSTSAVPTETSPAEVPANSQGDADAPPSRLW